MILVFILSVTFIAPTILAVGMGLTTFHQILHGKRT
jgi:hypothetical protein